MFGVSKFLFIYFKKLKLLFSKDALNWSEVSIKSFSLLRENPIKKS